MAEETAQDISFEIIAQTARSEQNVTKLQSAVKRLANDVANGNKTAAQADAIYKRYAKALGVTSVEAIKLKNAVNQMSQTAKRAVVHGGGMNFFIQQVGFLASDARYGLLGMANNLSLMVSLLPTVAAEAKKSGDSFIKGFMKGLAGPGGMILALQVLITVLPEIIEWFKKLGDESVETAKAIKELNEETTKLTKQIEEENEVLQKRADLAEDAAEDLHRQVHNYGRLDETLVDYLVSLNLIADKEEFMNMTRREKLKLLYNLADGTETLNKLAKEEAERINDLATAYKVLDIKGELTAAQKLSTDAEVAIQTIVARTGLAYSEAAELYWASNDGKIMAARIQKAKDDAIEKADKEAKQKQKEKDSFLKQFAPEVEGIAKIDRAEEAALSKAKELGIGPEGTKKIKEFYQAQRDEYLEERKKGASEFADSFLLLSESEKINVAEQAALGKAIELGLSPEQTARIGLYYDEQRKLLADKEAADKERKDQQRESRADAAQRFLNGLLGNEFAQFDHQRKILQDYRDDELISEEEHEKAKTAIKRAETRARIDIAAQEVAQLGQNLQALAKGNKKLGALAITGIVIEQASSVAKIWSKLPEQKAKNNAAFPGPLAPIAKVMNVLATVNAVAGTALAVKRAKDGINQVRKASGASGGGGGSAGTSVPPNFNVIGAQGTSQLQQSIEQQTAAQGDQKVVLVTSELETKQNDQKVAIQQSELG